MVLDKSLNLSEICKYPQLYSEVKKNNNNNTLCKVDFRHTANIYVKYVAQNSVPRSYCLKTGVVIIRPPRLYVSILVLITEPQGRFPV